MDFNKIVLEANQGLPVDSTGKLIDLRGSIAFTRDSKPQKNFLHSLFWVAQKVHAFLLGKQVDPYMAHGMLILGNDWQKENHLILAHGIFSGIETTSTNYLKKRDVTQLVVYIPTDEKLRQMLIDYGYQTAYTPFQFRVENRSYGDKHPKFSFYDMIIAVLNCARRVKTEEAITRVSYVIADLLLGGQIMDKNGKPASFFCAPYVFSILQATALIRALKKNEFKKLTTPHTRDEIAGVIASKIQNPQSALSKIYQTPICKWHGRWVLSSYATKALNRLSTPLSVIQRPAHI